MQDVTLKDQGNFDPTQFHQIVTDGGMGDLLCELVAVDWNVEHHPAIHFHVWLPDYLADFARHVLKKRSCSVRAFSRAKEKFRHDIEGMTTEWCTNHTPMRTHPVDYGFHMLSDRHIYNLNEKNYLQIRPDELSIRKFRLPEKYIAIAAAAAEPVKTMPVATINAISNWCVANGFTPVYLGKQESKTGFGHFAVRANVIAADYSKGINLLDRTDMLECAAVIANAACFVGMDGGLVHLAGSTMTPIVAGYTLVDPIHVAPIRLGRQDYLFTAIEPDRNIPNRYYQTYHSGFKKGDFRLFNGWQQVVASMTADKFLTAIRKMVL